MLRKLKKKKVFICKTCTGDNRCILVTVFNIKKSELLQNCGGEKTKWKRIK